METEKIKALEILGEAAQAMVDHTRLFVPLLAFLAVVSMIMIWPVLDFYTLLFKAMPENMEDIMAQGEKMLSEDLGYILFMVIPSTLVSMAMIVVWTRAVAGGPSFVFEGGFKAFLPRLGWSLWRYICALGIMVGAGLIVLLPLTLAQNASGAAILLFIVLYFLFLYVIFVLVFLLGVSLHGEARDFRLPIHRAYLYLKGNVARGTGGLLLGMLGIYLIQGMLMAILLGLILSDNKLAVMLGFFAMMSVSMLFNFLWIGYGAKYAMRLVPELRS